MTGPAFGFDAPDDGDPDRPPEGPGDPAAGGPGPGDPGSGPNQPAPAFGFGGGPGGPGGGLPGLPGDFAGALGGDLAGKIPLFAELQKLLSWQGGPVNWDLARQTAITALVNASRPVTSAERSTVTEAMRLADLWLDSATDVPSGVRQVQAWTRVDWIERTLPVWSTLCDPVASRVVEAMGSAVPEEAKEQAGALMGAMTSIGGLMFGAQVGQALASLAAEVVSSTDIGVPLAPAGTAVLLPENVAAFGAGLERPDEEVRLFLALREAAHCRLFGSNPWLRQRLLDTIDAYARGIKVDPTAIERAMGEIDPADPESMQRALSGGMFEPEETPEQQTALRRLETLLALIEGWVDVVVDDAARDRPPGAGALRETLRRRRASGGPAEQTFATLVGLELRPRRLREAVTLWQALRHHRGTAGRDAIWAHRDLLPTAEDLDDPLGFASGDTQALSIDDMTPESGGGATPRPGDDATG
ncbi:MAG: zinc-dependent metalloprotease [Mycobacteriales bacterium]